MSVRGAIRELFRGKAPALDATYPSQRDNSIVSYETSNLYYSFGAGGRYNPDDLVQQKGLTIYSRMLIDEQVKSVTEFKLNAILGRGWQFKFEGSTKLSPKEQKERIKVFEAICRKLRGSFVDGIEGIASGREFGLSITEKVYGQIEYDGATYTGINMLLTRDPCSFRFYADDYGMLQKITQQASGRPEIEIDRRKIIHYVHKPKWDLIYGRSELRSAYRSWYIKDQLVKLWAMHLEKFGSGIPVATMTENVADFGKLQEAMKNFKAFTSLILPPGVTAEVFFPTSTDQYQHALEYHDLAIAKSQLVPNLLGLSHTGQTGAYSQSQTQFEAFFWTTSTDGKRLAECLNEQLFRDLGDQNWGDGDYPCFCFKPMTLDAAIKLLAEWREQVKAGGAISTEDDERFIRELLEMPERDEDAEPLVDPMAERQQTHTEEQAQIANDQKQQQLDQQAEVAKQKAQQDRFTRLESEVQELRAKLAVNVTVHNPAPSQPATHHPSHVEDAGLEGGRVVPHGKLRGSTLEQFSSAVQRVAFSVIEKRTDSFVESAVDMLAAIIAKATRRALGDDANMAQLIDEDPSDVAAIDLSGADRGKLKGACRDVLVQSWELGSNLASNEIARARGEQLERTARRAKFVSLRDNAVTYFDTQSFRMAGDASDQVRKLIQQELQNGIKYGKTTQEVRLAIWERLLSKGMTTIKAIQGAEPSDSIVEALKDLALDEISDVAAYLNTLVRTNTFEALNEARFAEFTDPDVGAFVEALEYAAVLDSSTTEICRHLNGRIYKAESPEWDSIRPPNHFNCRSVLIPVTTIDGWDGRESDPPTVAPAEGFK